MIVVWALDLDAAGDSPFNLNAQTNGVPDISRKALRSVQKQQKLQANLF